ncbi:MAG: arylsulfatase [Microthrixaceae bacterium]
MDETAGAGPYAGFQGRVGRTVAGSESWWPPEPTAPEGAPNVVVVMADDLGFSDLGCYGSEIPTPHLDALAQRALRFSNYHATPMCSPTRAALLTGVNSHLAGVGHVAHSDSGFPGYAMELADDVASAAEIFADAGYFTAMVGKWHLTKDSHCGDAGPFDSWPLQRGFHRFYGFLDGFTNLHHPHRLLDGNSPVEVQEYPEGYYFTDDITDRAIHMVRGAKASNPTRPFFLYFSHGSVHAPLHAKAADIEAQRGRYDAGWDVLREERFARMQAMGLVDEGITLPSRNAEPGQEVAPWESLSGDERRLFARYMEVYAAMVKSLDDSFGALRAALEELGEWDNTIVMFTSDNGASREGEAEGTTAYFVHLLGETDTAADLARIDGIGGPTSMPHYPRGWAACGNTPFRLYKINTHAGGHQVPMIMAGPGVAESAAGPGVAERAAGPGVAESAAGPGEWRSQYVHVVDVLPTLLELTGVAAPQRRRGRELKPMQGISFASVLADPEAPSVRTEQYYEMLGHRGYYRDGWEVVTLHYPLTHFSDEEWELYDLTSDPTETQNLAGSHPDLVAELAEAWERAAWANQVYPLDEGSGLKYLTRPPWNEVYERPVTLLPGTPTLERWRALQLIMIRSFRISARLEVGPEDEGIIVAHGDQGGGYVLWLDADGVHLAHNDGRGRLKVIDGGPLPPGGRVVGADFQAPGGNIWNVTLSVDGETRGAAEGWPTLYPMAPFEGIDVGLDRRSPVHWDLYQANGAYPFTGVIAGVDIIPGDAAPDSPNSLLDVLRTMGAAYE